MNTAYSLAGSALGLAVAALAWLIAHTGQISKLLSLAPAAKQEATEAKNLVAQHLAAVKTGTETAVGDAEALAAKIAQHLADRLAPTQPAQAGADTTTTVTVPAPAPEPVTATPDGSGGYVLPDGTHLVAAPTAAAAPQGA